jgi:hypothetical protein
MFAVTLQAREIRLYQPCGIPTEASAYHCLGWEEATKVVRKLSALWKMASRVGRLYQ